MSDQTHQQNQYAAYWQQYYGYTQPQHYGLQPQPSPYNQNTAGLCPAAALPPPPPQHSAPYHPAPPPVHHCAGPTTTPNDSAMNKRLKESFHCDVCLVDMDSAMALEAHVRSHIKCTVCNYMASPKLIKAHHSAKHGKFAGSGWKEVTVAVPGCPVQRFRICVGNSPEDISKWIADRKKKFPRKIVPPTITEEPTKQALGTLLDGYGSSSSSDGDDNNNNDDQQDKKPEATPRKKESSTSSSPPPPRVNLRLCRYFSRTGKCRNGDACTFRHETINNNNSIHPSSSSSSSSHRTLNKQKDVSSATLLRKLLQTDEDRESMLTLQLLRYIANCNYLQEQRTVDE